MPPEGTRDGEKQGVFFPGFFLLCDSQFALGVQISEFPLPLGLSCCSLQLAGCHSWSSGLVPSCIPTAWEASLHEPPTSSSALVHLCPPSSLGHGHAKFAQTSHDELSKEFLKPEEYCGYLGNSSSIHLYPIPVSSAELGDPPPMKLTLLPSFSLFLSLFHHASPSQAALAQNHFLRRRQVLVLAQCLRSKNHRMV